LALFATNELAQTMEAKYKINQIINLETYQYRVVDMLRGGMGLILLCESVKENYSSVFIEKIAVKVFDTDQDIEQVRQELYNWSALRYINIVPLSAISYADDFLCAVMPWFKDGTSKSIAGAENKLARLKKMLISAANGLNFAYDKHSMLHLDIKPANILMHGNFYAISDWGISKIISKRAIDLDERVGGTLPYMSAERFRGTNTIQGDIYALGMSAYEIATNTLPFSTNEMKTTIREILDGIFMRVMKHNLSQLPIDWMELILKMCALDPRDRQKSYEILIRDLNNLET
jgi:serine/threonine protein kinase